MPNPTSLPPLVWLRAFCEAGRHGSFKAAAEELHVTPSTISHEIRKLEDWVQRPLFERRGPQVRLTREGEQLYEAVRISFDSLAIAFEQFSTGASRPLKIGMLPFFASELVIPRLGELTERLGGLRLQITSNVHVETLTHVDPARRLDAVIRFAEKPAPGFKNVELADTRIVPVATAGFVKIHPIKTVGDLTDIPQVQSDGIGGWRTIAEHFDIDISRHDHTISVDNYVSAMRAVEQGLGVGIALLPLTAHWLREQALVVFDAAEVLLPEKCWLVFTRETPYEPLFRDLAAWLIDELVDNSP